MAWCPRGVSLTPPPQSVLEFHLENRTHRGASGRDPPHFNIRFFGPMRPIFPVEFQLKVIVSYLFLLAIMPYLRGFLLWRRWLRGVPWGQVGPGLQTDYSSTLDYHGPRHGPRSTPRLSISPEPPPPPQQQINGATGTTFENNMLKVILVRYICGFRGGGAHDTVT